MGKRRNKKQGNRQNTGSKTAEDKKLAESKIMEKSDAGEQEQQFAEEPAALADASYVAETADSAVSYEEESAEPSYIEESAETSYIEESADIPDTSYAEDADMDAEQASSDVPIDTLLEDVDLSETKKKERADRQQLDANNDFADFTKDFFRQIGKGFKRNRRMAAIAAAVCAGVVIIIWIVVAVSKNIDEARLAASVPEILPSEWYNANSGMIPVPQEPLQIDAYPEVNELVTDYFEAVQNNDIETLRTLKNYLDDVEIAKVNAKYLYVERYDNITCYTKVGPIANSYIVFARYDVKMRDWDTTAPSLQTLFVCTNNEGNLYIYAGESDANVANYIASIISQADVYDLWQRVQTEYQEVMDENPEFAAYLLVTVDTIKEMVGTQLLDAGYLEEDADSSAEGEQPVDGTDVSDGNTTEPEEGTGEFEVQAMTTVNVRASDSEVADRLGRVEAGTVLLCQEHQVNGWSRVVYEDQVGYIKTEYLQTVGEGVDESAATGTITVSETVNVRRTPNIAGEQMGVAYAGESFPLIGNTDGEWTQIIYNGQTGYVKSEFILGR